MTDPTPDPRDPEADMLAATAANMLALYGNRAVRAIAGAAEEAGWVPQLRAALDDAAERARVRALEEGARRMRDWDG